LKEPEWLTWARKIQSVAQIGLAYAKDPYDRERYQTLRVLSIEIMERHTGVDSRRLADLFAGESGYQTPKLDVRAAVVRNRTILLVRQRGDDAWALPGGWVEVDTSLREAAIKEAREEAGATVVPRKLVAVLDRRKQDLGFYPYAVLTAYVGCSMEGELAFGENTETTAASFFPVDDLPPLSRMRTNRELILMCHRSMSEGLPDTVFD
jgi:ADP-ribose pyrophosphatase YjhB (NUDIX family)